MENKKLFYGILVVVLMIVGIGIFYLTMGFKEAPRTPITISLSIPPTIGLNETVDVAIIVNSILDAPNTRVDLILPEGVVLVSGNPTWDVDLTANTPVIFSAKIKMIKTGNWEIKAIAKKVIDQENIWGDMDIVYVGYQKEINKSAAGYQDNSGISGKVLIGPQCPEIDFEIYPEMEEKCKDKPYEATIIINRGYIINSKIQPMGSVLDEFPIPVEITRVVSFNGQFRVELQPGYYILVPLTPEGSILPRSGEYNVIVEQGRFTEVIIRYDTGIRLV